QAGPERPKDCPTISASDLLPAQTPPHAPRGQPLSEVRNGDIVLRNHRDDTITLRLTNQRAATGVTAALFPDNLNRNLPASRPIELRQATRLYPTQAQPAIASGHRDSP